MPIATLRAAVAAVAIMVHAAIGVWLVRQGMSFDAFVLYVGLGVPLVLYFAGRL